MMFFNRQVVPTTLDEIPRAFRALPGVIAISLAEIESLRRGDGETFLRLAAIVEAEDAADARNIYAVPKRGRARRRALSPSARLLSLSAVTRLITASEFLAVIHSWARTILCACQKPVERS